MYFLCLQATRCAFVTIAPTLSKHLLTLCYPFCIPWIFFLFLKNTVCNHWDSSYLSGNLLLGPTTSFVITNHKPSPAFLYSENEKLFRHLHWFWERELVCEILYSCEKQMGTWSAWQWRQLQDKKRPDIHSAFTISFFLLCSLPKDQLRSPCSGSG